MVKTGRKGNTYPFSSTLSSFPRDNFWCTLLSKVDMSSSYFEDLEGESVKNSIRCLEMLNYNAHLSIAALRCRLQTLYGFALKRSPFGVHFLSLLEEHGPGSIFWLHYHILLFLTACIVLFITGYFVGAPHPLFLYLSF